MIQGLLIFSHDLRGLGSLDIGMSSLPSIFEGSHGRRSLDIGYDSRAYQIGRHEGTCDCARHFHAFARSECTGERK